MARRMQKLSRKMVEEPSACPAISIVIPMYNAEKYIGECLDSILAQTFTNFEVIVVNDCSTDNSPAIVESYIPKFDGRLKLSHMKKNSGNAALPRNRGIKLSTGEYFYFMDADDAIIPTALEELYTVAKDFNADVVHCQKFYSSPGESASTDKSILTEKQSSINLVEAPTPDTQALNERVQKFVQEDFWWTPWSHLIRRETILENDLEFPKINVADDFIFTVYLYLLAEKVVTIPNAVYVWRNLKDSNSHADYTSIKFEKFFHRRVNDILSGIQLLYKFTGDFELFQKEPQYKFALIDFFVNKQIWYLYDLYQKFPATIFDKFIQKEFTAIGNDPVVAAFLFGKMMTYYVSLISINVKQREKINRFAAQVQERIKDLETQLANSQRHIAELEAQVK